MFFKWLPIFLSLVLVNASYKVFCPPNLGPLAGATSCADVLNDGSCYCAILDERSWEEQMTFCSNNGLKLLAIGSRMEEVAIDNQWGASTLFWTSGNNIRVPGTWIWDSTGETIGDSGYSNWGPSEPSNTDSAQDAVLKNFYIGGGWNDAEATGKYGAICEISD